MCLEQVKEGCGNAPTRGFALVNQIEGLCLNGLFSFSVLLCWYVMEDIPGDNLAAPEMGSQGFGFSGV